MECIALYEYFYPFESVADMRLYMSSFCPMFFRQSICPVLVIVYICTSTPPPPPPPPKKKKSKKFISHSARLKLSEGKGNGYMKCDNSSWLNTYRTAQQVKVHFKIQVHFKVYFQTLWRFTRIYLFSCYLKTNPTRDGSTVHTFRKWWRSLVMMAAMIPPPTSQTRRPNINVGGLTTEIL